MEVIVKFGQAWTIELLQKLFGQYVMVQENAQQGVSYVKNVISRQVNKLPMNQDMVGSVSSQSDG